MNYLSVGDELTVMIHGWIGRFVAVVISTGENDQPATKDVFWPPRKISATPESPILRLKYDYHGKGQVVLNPGDYIIYSFGVREEYATSDVA